MHLSSYEKRIFLHLGITAGSPPPLLKKIIEQLLYGKKARQRVLQHFTLDQMAQKTLKIYEEILAKKVYQKKTAE